MSSPPIFTPNPFIGQAYRTLSLTYYRTPLSSKGARLFSGRFNRLGVSALYLSLEQETALAEYHRLGPKRPCVLITAELTVRNLIDLTGDLSGLGSDWQDWDCDWEVARDRYSAGDTAADCASWRCGDHAIAANCAGVVFPSRQRTGGLNLALFTEDSPGGSLEVTLIDPNNEIMGANPVTL